MRLLIFLKITRIETIFKVTLFALGVMIMIFGNKDIYAQNYTRGIGLRGGSTSGIVYRDFKTDDNAYEIIFGTSDFGLKLTGLKTKYKPRSFQFADNSWLAFGFGAHVGFTYTDNYQFLIFTTHLNDKTFIPFFGFDGLIGYEYRLKDFPLVFIIDYKPYFEFSTRRYFNLNIADLAISFRYLF